jgi:hypothetical protein
MSATKKVKRLLGGWIFVTALAASTPALSASSLGSSSGTTGGATPELSVAVEFYHFGLDHYFVTADPGEIEALVSGKIPGWFHTGGKFAVLPPGSTTAGAFPVCRFYGDPTKGIDSHFYSAIASECEAVRTRFADSWLLESDDVYRVFLPDAGGTCPAGSEPVYRLWNDRSDVNHRYTTDPNVVASMKARGYIAEGLGALSIPVALCAPIGIACALAATNPTPNAGSVTTLTASCSGNPTTYVWSGCDSQTDTCTATWGSPGLKTYGLVAIGPLGTSDAVAVAVDWRPAGSVPNNPSSEANCTIGATPPTSIVGSPVTLTALCTVIPISYTWTGCASTTNTCTTTATSAGSATYSISARLPGGTTGSASISVNWQTSAGQTSVPTTAPTSAPVKIVSIPAGEARVISSNVLGDVWEGPQPAGGGTIDKGLQWCSAIFAPTLGASGSIVFSGGGDADSWDTAAFAFDLAAGTWKRIKDRTTALSWNPDVDYASPPSDPKHFDRTYGEHGDGTPGAPHTYDLVTYLPPEAVGGKGALLFPVTRFAYSQSSTNWAHMLKLDAPAWSRAATAPTPSNMNYLGMSDYDPTTKRVWVVPATAAGANADSIAYLDFSSGVGVPGSVSLGGSYLVHQGTLRFWRGTDGTKRYLVWIANGGIFLIDLDAPQTGVHSLSVVGSLPANYGAGFALGRTIGFAMHPTPDQDGARIYEITPPTDAIRGTWSISAKPLVGIALASSPNVGLWKRLEYIEPLGVVTFFVSARGPVYAYRPASVPGTTQTPASNPTPGPGSAMGSFAMDESQVSSTYWNAAKGVKWRTFNGDWLDANRVSQGTAPWAVSGLLALQSYSDPPKTINFDATALVQEWLANGNRGVLIRGSSIRMGSRDNPDASLRPYLTVVANGATIRCADVSDTTLDGGVMASIGNYPNIGIYPGENDVEKAAIQFDLSAIPAGATISSATISIVALKIEATQQLQAFLLDPPVAGGATTPARAPTPAPTPTPTPTPTPSPTSGPAPAPVTGSLKMTSVVVPYSGPGMAIAVSKHLDFARVSGRWFKCAGDHRRISQTDVPTLSAADANTPDAQGGRQEIISVNFTANDWRLDQPYFLRSGMNLGDMQTALPDDAFCIERNGEIWSFISARVVNATTDDETAAVRAGFGTDIVTQDMQHIGAWNPATKRWRSIAPPPQEMLGDTAWRGIWDAQTDRFIIPTTKGLLVLRGSDGADVSPRYGANNLLTFPYDVDIHSTGIVQDGRTAYVYDQTHGALYSFNLDQSPFVLTKVLDLPNVTYVGEGRVMTMAWNQDLRAVVIGGTGKLYAFEVDTRALTVWNRPDGFVNGMGTYISPSEMLYDPDTKDIVTMGTIDWDTGIVVPNYWRMHLSR